jgi:hypothetical protein
MDAMKWIRIGTNGVVGCAALGVLLGGCATSSHVMIGKARPPIPVTQVTVYMEPPAHYEQIAIIDASSEGSLQFGNQAMIDAALARLKQQAAKLGANGVLFQGSGDKPGAVIGAGGSNVSFGSNSSVGIGIGLSNQLMNKVVHGTAIYVPEVSPAAAPAPPSAAAP